MIKIHGLIIVHRLSLTLALVLTAFSFLPILNAQTYPYWDATEPNANGGGSGFGGSGAVQGPLLASTNALYSIQGASFARWTKCGGWESLPGLTVNDYSYSGAFAQKMMTIHSHYLYAVGSFTVGATDTRIAKFDFDTGTWTALGDSFTAANIVMPTTIAIDSSNRVYVGFKVEFEVSGDVESQLIDMLDVSMDDGSSWSMVGNGLTTTSDEYNGIYTGYERGISALHADGTNLYVGGDFVGSDTITSVNIIRWTGSAWLAMGSGGSGVTPDALNLFYEWDGDTVNAITTIGTNIYVAGNFTNPAVCLARFSSVTGDSLPTGDPVALFNWPPTYDLHLYQGATSLAVNGTNLYFGGAIGGGSEMYFLSCLTDPQADSPSGWTTSVANDGSDSLKSLGTVFLASTTNGNAIYVAAYSFSGTDGTSASSDGISRLVTSADGPSPTVTINSVDWTSTTATLHISGTPGSHWQVYETMDGTTWADMTGVTIWGGSTTITIALSDSERPSFELANNCTGLTNLQVVNVQFDGFGATSMTGTAGTGVSSFDYWNEVQTPAPVEGPSASPYDVYYTVSSLLNNASGTTGINISILYSDNWADAPSSGYSGSDPVPLLNSVLADDNGDNFTLSLDLPSGNAYDLYLYASYPGGGSSHISATFTLDGSSSLSPSTGSYVNDAFVEGNQYVVFRGVSSGSHTIDVSGGVEPLINGMQIVIH